jgi:hypothetical protein
MGVDLVFVSSGRCSGEMLIRFDGNGDGNLDSPGPTKKYIGAALGQHVGLMPAPPVYRSLYSTGGGRGMGDLPRQRGTGLD